MFKNILIVLVLFISCPLSAADMSTLDGGPGIRILLQNKNIETIQIEDYLKGILVGEVPSDWPIEALKAQAVVSRSYAMFVTDERRKKDTNRTYDLNTTVEDQVYDKSKKHNAKIDEAVNETRGEIITLKGLPIKARFHSSCGGATERSINVWGEADHSTVINDPYCKRSPNNNWVVMLTPGIVAKKLLESGFDFGAIKNITTEKDASSGRVRAVLIEGTKQTMSVIGNDFRRYLGFGLIKSTLFNVQKTSRGFVFRGSGFGHGVGMCQWGAKGMAIEGSSYRDIVNFYFPGTETTRYY